MRYVIAALPLLLVGCAKVSDYQAGCEQRYSKLSDMATCLDISIKNDSRMGSAATPKMYVLAAKLLGQKVDNGEISDAQARLELQSIYVNMQRQEQADNMAQSQALQKSAQQTYIDTYNALKPAPKAQTNTTCQSLGNTVNCQSY